MTAQTITVGDRTLDLSTPQIMGILNVTPDSFSDGGKYVTLGKAVEQVQLMYQQGASIIDIGGVSTRPGAEEVPVEQELERVVPVVEKIAKNFEVMISVDTSSPQVMRECVAHGAHMWNDVRALQEPGAVEAAAQLDVAVCLMHMQGTPKTMQLNPHYENVCSEVTEFLLQRAQACLDAKISKDKIILDPGFCFGKSVEENYMLLKHLDQLCATGYPILSALSRKSMIGAVTHQSEPKDRVVGSVSGALISFMKGAAIVRVHDVAETAQALAVFNAMQAAK